MPRRCCFCWLRRGVRRRYVTRAGGKRVMADLCEACVKAMKKRGSGVRRLVAGVVANGEKRP